MQKNRRIDGEPAMLDFGHRLAGVLQVGDCIALTGDLGAGKTTLSRGIIQALCGEIEVPSPTYTMVQTYETPAFEVWHCDLYRLKSPDDVHELGLLDIMEEAVCLIEWPERMGEYLPADALTINIIFEGDGRIIEWSGNEAWIKRLDQIGS